MGEVKITDLVDQKAIDGVKTLNTEMKGLLDTYVKTAGDLAKGLEINVKVVGDLDKLQDTLVKGSKEAAVTNERLNAVISEQGKVIGETSNALSRNLMEKGRLNKATREEYNDGKKVKEMLEPVIESYGNKTKMMAKLELQIKANKKAQQDLDKQYQNTNMSEDVYVERQAKLIAQSRDLAVQKSNLSQVMKIEEKMNQENESSYNHLSQQLELLKKTYKQLTEAQRDNEVGQAMEHSIQELDAHLKDLAADMGEFQRNVGNYAIAGQNGIVSTESLTVALGQEARTTQDLIDQTKILEEAKQMLNKADANYDVMLSAINGRLEENRRKLADVSDILGKNAKSVAEAEAQNKRLSEAIKLVDLTSADAKKRLEVMRAQIERNNRTISQATGMNVQYTDSMLKLIGVNANFGSSFQSLAQGGNFIEGLNVKLKAFGKTLVGLLTNPWALAFLGISGAVTAVKWWYDYNKGLERASLLTKNFSALVGDDMRDIRTKVQTLAETMGKGFDETIGAANTLANQFGISWNETMDIMKEGVVLGADLHGNMIDNIEKYAGAFKDAGIAADEFMAILVNTKDGLFDEKAMKGITDAGMRIRNMSAKTQKALEDIGISGQKMQDDLKAGNITMVEAIQQVTDRLQELPPNAQEVGSVMVNVFGKKSAMAGEEVIESISGINTNLQQMKSEMSEVQKISEEQIDAQNELNATIAAMFDITGGGFEEMTRSAKLFTTRGLTAVVKGCADVVNWCIRIYNASSLIRNSVEAFIMLLKVAWSVVKNTCSNIADQFKGLGQIMEGVFTVDPSLISKGVETVKNGYKDAVKDIAGDFVNAFKDAQDNIKKRKLNEIDIKLKTTGAADQRTGSGVKTTHDAEGTGWDPNADKNAKAAAKEAEKAAKEELKRLHELEESRIAMMSDGHEKELALIRQKFKKKIDEIQGEGETEKALRIQLAEQCQKEVADCETKYQLELSKINLENRLAAIKKGSKEELDIKLAQIEMSRSAEIEAAQKTGADIELINEKFNQQKLKLEEDYANKRAEKIMEGYAVEEIVRNEEYSNAVNALKKKYADELVLASGNAAKQEKIKKELDDGMFKLQTDYQRDVAESSVKMIEEILNLENMSAEDRLKWEQELAKAKIELADQIADANQESVERQISDDEKLRDKRKENLQNWLDIASDTINNISNLVNTLFDAKVERLEADQEANTTAGEKEQERITELVNKKVITEEEGEARKRAAEAQTAKKNEELEKKKAALQYKQAVFQKAVSIANIGIDTAAAIMKLWSQLGIGALPMQVVVGAIGALQLASVLATPIPKYAKGTDYHKGGPAIVGDGGRQEIILFRNTAWLTPDKPTLVDIPMGSQVIPDINSFVGDTLNLMTLETPVAERPQVIVNNDYSELRREIKAVGDLIRLQTKMQKRAASDREYELFKLTKI